MIVLFILIFWELGPCGHLFISIFLNWSKRNLKMSLLWGFFLFIDFDIILRKYLFGFILVFKFNLFIFDKELFCFTKIMRLI